MGASFQSGRRRSARVRGFRAGRAAGAGVLDVVRRGRLHSEMRGARHVDFSEFRHASDGGAACAQRQDIAGAAHLEIRGGGAARFEGSGLALPRTPRERNCAHAGMTVTSCQRFLRTVASRLYGPPPAVARKRQAKQNRIAAGPPLSNGWKTGASTPPLNKWPRKEGKANSPDRT